MPYEPFNKHRITSALRRLGELARGKGVTLEVSLYGGAVFTVVYGSRVATKDVDALVRPSDVAQIHDRFFPHDALSDAAREVAREAIKEKPKS